MGEPETELVVPEVPETIAGEEAPTSPDDSPDPKEPPKDDLQKKIADQAYKRRVAEREAENLRKQVAELQAKNQPARPVVPDLVDPLRVNDVEFRQNVAEREEAIRQAAAHDARQEAIRSQQQAQEAARQQAQHEVLQEQAKTYSARAVQLGVKPEELQAAGKVVGDFGIDSSIAEMILQDDQGPLIVKYLAQNLAELDDLNQLSVPQAAVRIATSIKAKAASLKPRVSNAPDPLKPVRGGGMPPADYGPKGATYE